MGLFENIKNRIDERRLKRLEGDLKVLEGKNKYSYDIALNRQLDAYTNAQAFSTKIIEKFVWFKGDPLTLIRFYDTNPEIIVNLNFFWRNATPTYRKIHSGIPKLLCTKMPIIIFGSGYTIDLDVFKVDEATGKVTDQVDEETSKQAKDNLQALLNNSKLNIYQLLEQQATNESRDGHTFAKLSYDKDLSPYPIYEVGDIRYTEIVKERGITKAIIFKHYLGEGTKESVYVWKEIYTTDEENNAVIENKLFKFADGKEQEVPLDSHKATKYLVEQGIEKVVFKGVKGMLAFEKPNRLPNSEFMDSPYGDSDYAGSISAFDGADEVASEIYAEIRNNKTVRYIPKSMLKTVVKIGDDGEPFETTEDLNNFITNYQIIDDVAREQEAKKVEYSLIPDKMESLKEKWKVSVNQICNNAGISPLALGFAGLESVSAGADSQRERNKATIETRAKKIELWKPYLTNLFIRLLDFNKWMRDNIPGIKDAQKGLQDVNIDWDNCNVSVTFPDYIVETDKQLIDTWGSAKTQGIASLETCIDNLHKEWDEAKKEEEVNRIKFEAGMSVENPLNLQELTDLENQLTNPNSKKEEEQQVDKNPKETSNEEKQEEKQVKENANQDDKQ